LNSATHSGGKVAAKANTPRKSRPYGSRTAIALLLLPALLLYTVLSVGPAVLAIVYSFLDWKGLEPQFWDFNGFRFYHELFHDRVVFTALVNMGRGFVLFTVVTLPVALVLSFILSRYVRGVSFFRALYFIPMITSVVLVALVFRLLFTSDAGINGLLRAVGLGGLIHPWLSEGGIAQWIMNVPQTWMYVGFWVVIFVAAIRGIDEGLFEAAEVDGATKWQQLWHVTIPSIRGVILFALVMTLIFSIQAFIFQLIMPTEPGGPFYSTHTLGSYTASLATGSGSQGSRIDWGYASTLSVLLFALSAVGAALIFVVSRLRQADR
jgi:raffinose/stachyose/melibiose transport system permease protein